MSSRYDSRTTTFSPEGRLYQVEYAVEAISHAGTAIGLVTAEGIIFATEKRMQNTLLDTESVQDKNISGDKVFKVDGHIACAVAGITSDANALIEYARMTALRHKFDYQEPVCVEDVAQQLCDIKQQYTQYGGVRPFGVALLLGGWDKFHSYQLYQTDPSGNYNAWKAYAVGSNDGAAQSLLKQEWKEGMTLQEGLLLALKVLTKTMDSTNIGPDRVEIGILTRVTVPAASAQALLEPGSPARTKAPQFSILTAQQLKPLLAEAERLRLAEEAAQNEQ